jgi:hypothetical protein
MFILSEGAHPVNATEIDGASPMPAEVIAAFFKNMRRVVISYKLEVLVNGFKLMIQDTDFFSNGVLKQPIM